MADDAAAPSVGVSQPRPSSSLVPSFRDVSRDAIHANFFPFSAGPYYDTYPQDGVVGNYEFTCEEWDAPYRPTFGVLTKEVFTDHVVCKNVVDQFPTPEEMVRVEALSEDQLTAKMSVLHCMMMSHGGELLARYRGLLQSRHEYVHLADSRLKGFEEKVVGAAGLELQATVLEAEKDEEILRLKTTPPEFASYFRRQFQDLVRKFLASDEFSRDQGELLSLTASVGFEHGLSMHQTKNEFATVLMKMDLSGLLTPPPSCLN
ncbi:hypothetical protein Tco_0050521 [Tanacetum coccineum]